MLWQNISGTIQVLYDRGIEPVIIAPQFAINDLDVEGIKPSVGFIPLASLCEVLTNRPKASICLARVSSIGDILLLLPVFYRIKEIFPLCHLFFASVRPYLSLVKYIDIVTPVEYKRIASMWFDFGYDFNLSVERAEGLGWGKEYHRSEIYAKLLGLALERYRFHLPYSSVEKDAVAQALKAKGYTGERLIGFQVKGAAPQRSLAIEKAKGIVSRLTSKGINVALFDASKDAGWEGDGIINLCGELSILELVAAVDRCDLVVSMDSGITHIAGALGKKNVALFACIPAKNRVKYPNCKVLDLASAYGCKPCWESGEKCGQRWSCLIEADENLIYDEIIAQL